jgi:PleD family two-component response regulator
MGHTPSVNEMIAVVQDYIHDRKRVKVKIVLDDPMRMRRDVMLLNEAYSIAVMYNNKDK